MSELGFWNMAAAEPDRIAVVDPAGCEHRAGSMLERANQLVRALRVLGMKKGDTLATLLPNGIEILELYLAAAQAGWYLTPINWHLAPAEVAYILADCDAKAFFADGRFSDVALSAANIADLDDNARICVGEMDGFRPIAQFIADHEVGPVDDRWAGTVMTYTSGTTGKPKGVRRALGDLDPETMAANYAGFLMLFGIMPGTPGAHLVVSPTYHTAVFNFSTNFLHIGHTVVLMDKWTPEDTLRLIERHGITTSHMVPTQFSRLLSLPEDVRTTADLSSLQQVIHSAAPCPVPIKHQMLEWWGPVIYEYYAASEGGGTLATPQDWLDHPGTVGNAWPISEILVLDDDGQPSPTGTPGTVFMKMGDKTFEYHKDRAKTDSAWREGFFTVGDIGYLDEDGFLFLCDRKIDMIISGGVNIYPAEIECELITHDLVVDVAVFGIPNEDWGEEVKAVVELVDGVTSGPETEGQILDYCRERLAKYKWPRSIDFVDELPRDPNGKLYKRKLRDPYWEGHTRAI